MKRPAMTESELELAVIADCQRRKNREEMLEKIHGEIASITEDEVQGDEDFRKIVALNHALTISLNARVETASKIAKAVRDGATTISVIVLIIDFGDSLVHGEGRTFQLEFQKDGIHIWEDVRDRYVDRYVASSTTMVAAYLCHCRFAYDLWFEPGNYRR